MAGYLRNFQRELKLRYPDIVYVLVPEPHPGGHGWHVHGAANRYIPKSELADMWGRGFVDVRRFKSKGATGAREAARRAGAYLAKYVAKSMAHGRQRGEHRFYRPQNITMKVLEASGTFADCMEALKTVMTGPILWSWSSRGVDSWRGPPVVAIRW